MVKGRKRAREAVAVERAMKRIDRGVARYGASAMAKYYVSPRRTMLETKYFDTLFGVTVNSSADWNTTAVAMTSYMSSDGSTVAAYTDAALIPSAVGSGYGQVVGNKYNIKKLRIRGELIPAVRSDSADVAPAGTVRVLLVEDTQPNGAQATGAQLLTDWGTANQCQYSFQAIAAGMGGRFRVLYDRTHIFQPANASTDGASTTSNVNSGKLISITKVFKKPRRVLIKGGSATPTVASLGDCNIFLLAHNAGTATVSFNGNSRCYYEE